MTFCSSIGFVVVQDGTQYWLPSVDVDHQASTLMVFCAAAITVLMHSIKSLVLLSWVFVAELSFLGVRHIDFVAPR